MSVGGLVLERASSRALTAFSLKVALAFGALTAALAPIAYMAMFSGFHAYDDEGYYLANLGDYLAGRPLLTPYAQVYGPFFYEVVGGLFKVLGLAPDNDNGRLVTVGAWLIASVAGGLVAFRLSKPVARPRGAAVDVRRPDRAQQRTHEHVWLEHHPAARSHRRRHLQAGAAACHGGVDRCDRGGAVPD